MARKQFELDEAQLAFILTACKTLDDKPDPEFVGRAWDLLGKQLGFNGRTCEQVEGKDEHFFTAEEAEQ